MQTLKVEWVENATASNGNPFKKLSIRDGVGKTYNVNIFSDFLDFANIQPGSTIVGNLVKQGKFWNIVTESFQAPRRPYKPKPSTDPIVKVMERKELSINGNMDRKEEGIRLSGSQRDAVLVTTAMGIEGESPEEVKRKLTYWRNYFLSEEFNRPLHDNHEETYQAREVIEDSPF